MFWKYNWMQWCTLTRTLPSSRAIVWDTPIYWVWTWTVLTTITSLHPTQNLTGSSWGYLWFRITHAKFGRQSLFFVLPNMIMQLLYLNRLHWLPVKERNQFKVLLYVFKCLNGHAPSYLASRFTRYHKTRTGLRSAQDNTRLSVPNFRRKALQSAADKSFSLAAPLGSLDNLPASIRTANLVERVCKTREEEEVKTITFHLKCIVIA